MSPTCFVFPVLELSKFGVGTLPSPYSGPRNSIVLELQSFLIAYSKQNHLTKGTCIVVDVGKKQIALSMLTKKQPRQSCSSCITGISKQASANFTGVFNVSILVQNLTTGPILKIFYIQDQVW